MRIVIALLMVLATSGCAELNFSAERREENVAYSAYHTVKCARIIEGYCVEAMVGAKETELRRVILAAAPTLNVEYRARGIRINHDSGKEILEVIAGSYRNVNGRPFDGVEDIASFSLVGGVWTWQHTSTLLQCVG